MLYSFVAWLPVPLVPFLPLGAGTRALLGAGLVASAEVAFWCGLVLAGREVVARLQFWKRRARVPEPVVIEVSVSAAWPDSPSA